jgi:hypothetical protein
MTETRDVPKRNAHAGTLARRNFTVTTRILRARIRFEPRSYGRCSMDPRS